MRHPFSDEHGFTLIELLTVILIIGVLAAIALALFMGQTAKAHDAAAKSDARTMQGAVEACYSEVGSYNPCPAPGVGVDVGPGRGQVEARPAGDAYVVVARSRSGNDFTIERDARGVISRSCTDLGTPKGGCHGGNW